MGKVNIFNDSIKKQFAYLENLKDETKKSLIEFLSATVGKKQHKDINIKSLAGAWEDDRSSDEIILDIKQARLDKESGSF